MGRPLDALLFSLADSFGSGVLAVVLTGMGGDGDAGAGAIRVAGGTVVVQSPETAEQEAMPKATSARSSTQAGTSFNRMSPDWAEMRALDGRGFIADTGSPSTSWLDQYIDPEDQPEVLGAIRAAIDAKSVFELEHRVRRPDGSLGWTVPRGAALRRGRRDRRVGRRRDRHDGP